MKNGLIEIIITGILKSNKTYSLLNKDNILFKEIDGEIIGKRCVDTVKRGKRWLEELTEDDEIYRYLHPKDADYKEVFYYTEK